MELQDLQRLVDSQLSWQALSKISKKKLVAQLHTNDIHRKPTAIRRSRAIPRSLDPLPVRHCDSLGEKRSIAFPLDGGKMHPYFSDGDILEKNKIFNLPRGKGRFRRVQVQRLSDPDIGEMEDVAKISSKMEEMSDYFESIHDEDAADTVSDVNDARLPFQSELVVDNMVADFIGIGCEPSTFSKTSTRSSLNEYRTGCRAENSHFDSVANYTEMAYWELMERERDNMYKPTKLKAAVCADLLLKLCSTLQRYSKALTPLVYELLNCVFVGYAKHTDCYKKELTVKELHQLPTYFARFAENHDMFEELRTELDIVERGEKMRVLMNRYPTVRIALDPAARYLRITCFAVWLREYRHDKYYKGLARRKELRYRFVSWQSYLKQWRRTELTDFSQDLDAKIEKLNSLYLLLETHNQSVAGDGAAANGGMLITLNGSAAVPSVPTIVEEDESLAETLEETAVVPPAVVSPHSGIQRPAPLDLTGAALSGETETSVVASQGDAQQTPTNGGLRNSLRASFVGRASFMSTLPEELGMLGASSDDRSGCNTPVGALPKFSRASFMGGAEDRKGYLNFINRRLSHTLSSFAIAPAAMRRSNMHGMMPPGGAHPLQLAAAAAAAATGHAMGQGEEGADVALDRTLNVVEQASALASSILFPTKDVMLQTPDAWMSFMNEADVDGDEWETGTDPNTVNNVHNRSKLKKEGKFKLDIETTCKLITFIYTYRFNEDGWIDVDFTKTSLLEFAKEAFMRKYAAKRLADKFYKGLMDACNRDGANHKRIELFANLCGVSVADEKDSSYRSEKVIFFFRMLGSIFNSSFRKIKFCLNNAKHDVDHGGVLEALPKIFKNVKEHDAVLYKHIVKQVMEMQPTNRENQRELKDSYKVDIDDVLLQLIDYYEFELLDQDLKSLVSYQKALNEDIHKSEKERLAELSR